MPSSSLRPPRSNPLPVSVSVATTLLQWSGIILLALAAASALRTWYVSRSLLRAEATVTENTAAQDAKGSIVYTTHLRFRLPSGSIVTFADPIQSSEDGDPNFATGVVVPVVYPADHPSDARIATVWRFYFVADVLGIFGVIMVDLALVLRGLLRRRVATPT